MSSIESKRLLANILTNDRISIEHDRKAETAYVLMEDKHIVLPMWNIDDDSETFLTLHEISHILYTPLGMWTDAIKAKDEQDQNLFKTIMNIVEDNRIDRKMNLKFPGSTPLYKKGVEKLYQLGFFNNKETFLAKLNLYLKYGRFFSSNVKFENQFEQDLHDESAFTSSFEDVLKVSQKIFEYVKDNQKERESKLDKAVANSEIFDFADRSSKVSTTDKSINSKHSSEDQSDQKKKIPLKPVLSGKYCNQDEGISARLSSYFERIKRANQFKETYQARSGNISEKLLHSYKFNSNIFDVKNFVNMKNESHYVCLVVDDSGSMGGYIETMQENLALLLDFFEKSRINYDLVMLNGHHITKPQGSKKISHLMARGSTPLSSAVYSATPLIVKAKEQKKSLIVISDGHDGDYFADNSYICDVTGIRFKYERFLNLCAAAKVQTGCKCIRLNIGYTSEPSDVFDSEINLEKDKNLNVFYELVKAIN